MAQTYFHVTPSMNRASIEEHGLDWRRMGATHGIAGVAGVSMTPEVEGVFLLESEAEIDWFAHIGLEQGHGSIDVWEVSLADDAELVESPEGYSFFPAPIPPEAVRLHTRNWTSRDPGVVAGELFHAVYYGAGRLDPETLAEDVVVIDDAGNRRQGRDALSDWGRARAHGAAPDPEPQRLSDGTLLFELEISDDAGFAIEGIDYERCLVSPMRSTDRWTVVEVRNNLVAELREFKTRSAAASEFPQINEI